MKSFTAFFAAALCSAQVATVSISPRTQGGETARSVSSGVAATARIVTAEAILGYATGPSPTVIRAILGTPRKHEFSQPLPVPAGVTRIYLPPRELYALIERDGEDLEAFALSDANPFQHHPFVMKAAIAHPDVVAFSPRGESAILYSRATGRLQIYSGLPSEPTLLRELAVEHAQVAARFVVTDDGSLLVAEFADGKVAFSLNSAPWQPLHIGYVPTAWSFVPNTHDLVVSDLRERSIAFIPNAAYPSREQSVPLHGIEADLLAVTKGGESLVAGSSSSGTLSLIDLKTRRVTALPGAAKLDSLNLLRDGRSFLLSTSPLLSLVNLGDPSVPPTLSMHVGIGSDELKTQLQQ